MKKWIAALVVCFVFVSVADARPRIFRSRTRVAVSVRTFSGSPQQVAQQKAEICASRCRGQHLGGGYGGANAEGYGVASTPGAALASCCFSGTRRIAGQAVVRGSNGMYFAIRLFW